MEWIDFSLYFLIALIVLCLYRAIKGLLAIPVLFFTSTVGAHALIRGSHIFGIRLWEKSIIDDYAADGFGGRDDKSNQKEINDEIS